MFRISVCSEGATRLVRLAGWLTFDAVADLRTACLPPGSPVALDLTDLRSIDEAGLEELRRLSAAGVHLLHVPSFVDLLLRAE